MALLFTYHLLYEVGHDNEHTNGYQAVLQHKREQVRASLKYHVIFWCTGVIIYKKY